jgi:lipid II:glycine glycyltransferase (peptidoglycan interpeptide bridge formation enzyme)
LLLDDYNNQVNKTILFTEVRNYSQSQNFEAAIINNGYVFNDHLNIFKDLSQSREVLWNGLRSSARNSVRKACKNNVTIHELSDDGELHNVYTLLRSTYRRIKIPVPDFSLFHSAYKILHPKNMMSIFVASVKSTNIAALAVLHYQDIIICWYTGCLPKFSSYRPNDLLFWYVTQWGKEKGFRKVDFGGAGKPDIEYGVRKFKSKFGDEVINPGRYIRVHSPNVYKFFHTCYRAARIANVVRTDYFIPSPTT